jgi:hypothetical protein
MQIGPGRDAPLVSAPGLDPLAFLAGGGKA